MFRNILGQELHIVKSHPEIALACQKLSRRVNKLNTRDLAAAKRVGRYLESRKDYGLTYVPANVEHVDALKSRGSTDSGWDCEEGSKSTAAYDVYVAPAELNTAAVIARTALMETYIYHQLRRKWVVY